MESGGDFTKGVINNLLEHEGKKLGIEYRTEEEYASQIRSLSDNISPRREPFQAPFLRAESDNFGSWVFATTSNAFDEDRDMVQVVRVNPQSRILTAQESIGEYSSVEDAIKAQDLTADRKFVHFHTQLETVGDNIKKYHMVESLVRRLQQKLLAQESSQISENVHGEPDGSLSEVIRAIGEACKKYPDAMRGYSYFLGHRGDKQEILHALKSAGVINPIRAKVLQHFPISDVGLEGGFTIRQDKNLGRFSLKFQPDRI